MAYNYLCAPTCVEVPFPGSTTATTNLGVPTGSTPTSAHPMANSSSPMDANANDNVREFNASHTSPITADGVHDYSHCSAVTANSEHDSQLLHSHLLGLEHCGYVQDVPPQGVPNLVTGPTEDSLPVEEASPTELSRPANSPRDVGMAPSSEFPPCVAAAVVVNSSRNSRPCDTYHPAERRLSAVNPRDVAGTLHEVGPCEPSSRTPTAFAGVGPEGETPNDTGHHYHDEHDGTGHPRCSWDHTGHRQA
jgi:hypothetical protein